MQDVIFILLLQECAIKTDSYWGLTFLGFLKNALPSFFICHILLVIYISQIHHVSRSKHKIDVKLQISVRKKKIAKNSKIGLATLKFHVKWKCFIPLVFFHDLCMQENIFPVLISLNLSYRENIFPMWIILLPKE
jgi:hypothetical protein